MATKHLHDYDGFVFITDSGYGQYSYCRVLDLLEAVGLLSQVRYGLPEVIRHYYCISAPTIEEIESNLDNIDELMNTVFAQDEYEYVLEYLPDGAGEICLIERGILMTEGEEDDDAK